MIAILLSTYNGEKYLQEQLNSLLGQTFKSFILYIRDDGSSDKTLSILLDYEKKFDNIVLLHDTEQNRGACKSFLWLLSKIEADYYMFCDQDDVWFPNKIQVSFDAMICEQFREKKSPIVVHTDLVVTDSKLNIISKSLWQNDRTDPAKITRKYLKIVNYITGCTMLFNRTARDLALINLSDKIIMHDFWISMCVDSNNGSIVTLPIPTIYYRQHSNNTIGASRKIYKYPRLQRYLHLPDIRYSRKLYEVLKLNYQINFFEYLLLRTRFYLKM